MKKILLLNPPASGKFQRDYYCSHSVKADYLWQPLDLQILSGFLTEFDLFFIDGIKNDLSHENTYKKIKKIKPDFIICQIGSACLINDIKFLKKIFSSLNIKIIITGDIARSDYKSILVKYNFIHAIIYNICENSIKDYIIDPYSKDLNNIITRNSNNIIENKDFFNLPLPEYDFFYSNKYILPYSEKKPIYTTLSNFGCPFSCKYCHFEKIYGGLRNPENLYKDLKKAKEKGFKYIHFRDQTFGYNKEHTDKLIKILSKIKLPFTIYSRVDVLNYKTLKNLKLAGLDTIEIGVESILYSTRKKYNKNIPSNTYLKFFNICRKLNIKTSAIFILGFPEDSHLSESKYFNFIKKLKPDFLSLNILIPKHGTSIQMNHSNKKELDPSKGEPEKFDLYNLQIKLYKKYYFSSEYILRKLIKLNSLSELINLSKNAFSLLKKKIFPF